jgi:hypothetical protein
MDRVTNVQRLHSSYSLFETVGTVLVSLSPAVPRAS